MTTTAEITTSQISTAEITTVAVSTRELTSSEFTTIEDRIISSSSSSNIGIIIGTVFGILFLIAIFLLIIFIFFRRKKQEQTTELSLQTDKIENIIIKQRIGGGNFGDVYLGMWNYVKGLIKFVFFYFLQSN